jgi:hypothetical protein
MREAPASIMIQSKKLVAEADLDESSLRIAQDCRPRLFSDVLSGLMPEVFGSHADSPARELKLPKIASWGASTALIF